jgi:hypothetical protein
MAKTGTLVFDNWKDFYGGMNGDLISSVTKENQYLKGINITCRGGVVRTRPGFSALSLSFSSSADARIFTKGKFQGASVYHTSFGTFLVCAVSGNVFVIDPDTGRVANATTPVGRLNQYADRLFFCQVEQYFIIQDGTNIPIIMDGLTARLANHDVATAATKCPRERSWHTGMAGCLSRWLAISSWPATSISPRCRKPFSCSPRRST